MAASWDYVRRLAQRSEEIGFDLTLIAELLLNDIKGIEAPSLDAWSTAAALAAVTRATRAHGRGASVVPSAGDSREAGGEHRSHLERTARAQRRVGVVEGRSAALRRGVRRARRPLRAHDRVARRRRRRVARAVVQLSRALLSITTTSCSSRSRSRRAESSAADDLRRRRVRGGEVARSRGSATRTSCTAIRRSASRRRSPTCAVAASRRPRRSASSCRRCSSASPRTRSCATIGCGGASARSSGSPTSPPARRATRTIRTGLATRSSSSR